MNDILSTFLDQRISIVGHFDKHATQFRENGNIRTTLVQDCYAEVDGLLHDIGHSWFQHTDEMLKLDLKIGTKLRCSCRVKEYKRFKDYAARFVNKSTTSGLAYELKYSLCYPTNIEILTKPHSPIIAAEVRPPLADAVAIAVAEPKLDKLAALQLFLQSVGGVKEAVKSLDLVDTFGGTSEVRKFLQLLG